MDEGQKTKMKRALLLNAFVLPGLGHIYLKRWVMGVFLAIASFFFLFAPIIKYMIMMGYATNLLSSANSPNSIIYFLEASRTIWPEVLPSLLMGIGGIIIVWSFGVLDVYIKLRKGEKDARV